MRIFQRFVLLSFLIIGLGLAGCSKTIPIGAVVSETGAVASYGEKVKNGLDLAAEEINSAGGFKGKSLELIYRDDGTNAEVGKQVVEQLIAEHNVKMIIGAVSSPVTLAIAPICEEKGVILLSPTASAPTLTDAGDYIFRNYPSDVLEGTAMANFARDLGLERLALFAVDNEFGRGLKEVFAEKFESKFRKIVGLYDFEEGDFEGLRAMVDELKAEKPDGVYIVGYVNDVAELLKLIRDAGLRSVILTSSSVTDDLVRLAGPATEDLVFPQPTFDPDAEEDEVKSFVEAYRAKYDQEPDNFSAHGYDSLKILLQAMEQMESYHPRDIKVGLHSIDNYRGASGRVAFDRNGDVVQYPRLFIIRQGQAVAYDRFIEEGGSLRIPGRG
jgi:branched-chain amino acid transport system substrate-binding protein